MEEGYSEKRQDVCKTIKDYTEELGYIEKGDDNAKSRLPFKLPDVRVHRLLKKGNRAHCLLKKGNRAHRLLKKGNYDHCVGAGAPGKYYHVKI
jgi:hypothetical protein